MKYNLHITSQGYELFIIPIKNNNSKYPLP